MSRLIARCTRQRPALHVHWRQLHMPRQQRSHAPSECEPARGWPMPTPMHAASCSCCRCAPSIATPSPTADLGALLGCSASHRGRTAWHVVATGQCGWRCEACGFGPTGGTLPSTSSSWKSARAHLPSRTVGAAHGTRQLQRCRQPAAPSDCAGRPDRSAPPLNATPGRAPDGHSMPLLVT
jgi:hypothetical protein